MTTISLRLDDDLKRDLDQMCSDMGMSLTTFFTIYAKSAFDPDQLDWEKIGRLLDEAEREDGDDEGIPWETVKADMRRRVHGRL